MTRRGVGAVLVLTSLILAPMVTLIALVRLWRAPRSRKWPWALFILLGIGISIFALGMVLHRFGRIWTRECPGAPAGPPATPAPEPAPEPPPEAGA